MKQKRHIVDLNKYQIPEKARADDSKAVHSPFDMPIYLRVYRLMEETPQHNPPKVISEALRGHTLEVDAFTFGVKIFVRLGMDGTLKVFAEDADGTNKLEEWSKE